MKRTRKDQKGISTVLATLMMIIVAVAGSLVTYAWVMGYLNFTTAKAGNALQIQSIAYNIPTGSATATLQNVYVQNVGQTTVKFDASSVPTILFINGAKITLSSNPATLGVGETANLVLPAGVTASVGSKVLVRIVAFDGSFAENTFYPS